MEISTGNAILYERPQQRPKIQFIAVEGKRIGLSRGSASRQLLDPHGSLPFESHFASEAEKGSGRVEESSRGSGRKRPHLFLNELYGGKIALWKTEGCGRQVR